MKASRIQVAVCEAQRELARINPQIESLTERRDSLQSFLVSGQMLLKKNARPDASQSEGASDIQRDHPAFNPKREVWQNIAEVLKQTGRPMMPKEIVETMERSGTPVNGSFPRDNVRNAMNRKSEIFERMGQGYGLKTWAPEVKQGKHARVQ